MKETDVLLGGFATAFLSAMETGDLAVFEALLEENDNDLLNWIFEREPVPQGRFEEVLIKIIEFKNSL